MTIASTSNRVSYVGNGVTQIFAVAFPFASAADLIVLSTVIATGVQTLKVITSDYTVSGTPDALGHYSSGGSITMLVAPANTERLTIYRDPSPLQTLNLQDNSAMPAESLEAQLDYATMLIQRLSDRMGRALRQPDGDSANIAAMLSAVSRANSIQGYDANGDPTAVAALSGSVLVVPNVWTPVVTANVPGNLSVGYTYQQGQVITIGKFALLYAQLIFTPTFTTATGAILITGSPVTPTGNAEPLGTAAVIAENVGTMSAFNSAIDSTPNVKIYGTQSDGVTGQVFTTVNITNFTTGQVQRLSFLLAFQTT